MVLSLMKSNYGDVKLEKCCQPPSNWMFRNKNHFYRKIAVHFSSCVAMFKLSVRQHWKCRPRMNLLELLNQLSVPTSLWPLTYFHDLDFICESPFIEALLYHTVKKSWLYTLTGPLKFQKEIFLLCIFSTNSSVHSLVWFRSICINQQVGEVLPQLVQLQEGLSTCGVLGAVQKSPKLWESAFVAGAGYSVTANNLIDEIKPEFSLSQLKKEKEADCYHYLCEFIHSLEAKCKYQR